MSSPRTALLGVLAGGTFALGLLTGCSDGTAPAGADRPAPPPTTSGAPTETPEGVLDLQPGAPGEPNETRQPGDPVPSSSWNHDDVAFLQMMVLHHRQALDMAELAETRVADRQVRAIADRIQAAQGAEILVMADWLTEQGVDVPSVEDDPQEYDHAQHGHHSMVGMLTADEMAELRSAEGTAFDRLFLRSMIGHHEGAVEMADDVLHTGEAILVNELAADVNVGQTAEIDRMRRVLGTLGQQVPG